MEERMNGQLQEKMQYYQLYQPVAIRFRNHLAKYKTEVVSLYSNETQTDEKQTREITQAVVG